MPKVPKYQALYQQMLERIIAGDFDREQRLPSCEELAGSAGVSYMTARKVYEQLCRNGLVEARRGRGFFVKKPHTMPLIEPVKNGNIGFLIPASSEVFYEVYQRLTVRLQAIGISPTLLGDSVQLSNYSQEQAEALFHSYAVNGIDTLVIFGHPHLHYRALQNSREKFRRFVFIMEYAGEMAFPDDPKVLFGKFAAGRLAAEQLLATGFRKLLFLTQEPIEELKRRRLGVSNHLSDLDMLDGVEAACLAHGINFAANGRIIAANMPYADHEGVMRRLTEAMEEGFDGFVCMNDNRAVSVYQAATLAGKKIGIDLGVTGAYNTISGSVLHPRLTTIDWRTEELADATADLILAERLPAEKTIHIEPKLIKRS